ncbi:DUF2975 domain-containing protein [Devosia sp.]|uniref:DUF2975 domain-containing protein n=1 Tax=Devosia sp. TaxID=1871048 RepID=UPI0032647CFF
MIDTRAVPLDPSQFLTQTVAVDGRTALMFNSLAVGSVALAALLPLGVVAYWGVVEAGGAGQTMGFTPQLLPHLDLGMRLGAIGISLLAVAPLCWGLLRLRSCFSQFAQGRPFAARGIGGLRDFAAGMAVSVLAKPISFTLLTLLLSRNAPAGQRQLAIRLDSDTLVMALFAATIASLAWAMQKAAAIAEENSQFV